MINDRIKKEKVKQKKKEDYFNDNGKDVNIFAYARVSTTSQQIGNQFEEIFKYCNEKQYNPPSQNIFFDAGVSGGISWLERKTKQLYDIIPNNGTLIVSEISRLGRNALEVLELLSCLFRKNITIHDIKNELIFKDLDDDKIFFKIIFLSVYCQMEKKTIQKRVAIAVNNNINKKTNKLDTYKEDIKNWKNEGKNANEITNLLQEKGLDINKSQVYVMFKKI